jgi:iron complex outermembrane receptor protein
LILHFVAASLATAALAQDTLPRKLLPVVTVTRDVGRSPLDLPYAINSIQPDSIAPGQTHTNIDELLALLPGVTVANRTNPSQDTRISIRGFGARSQFGARSIHIMRDGMPLTLPDGQTPIDYLDLEAVGRVDVIRGTASALYGNASGGVIDLRSVDPPDVPLDMEGRSWAESNFMRRDAVLLGGTAGSTTYEGNIGHSETDGYRAFSQQRLTNAFGRVATTVGTTELTLLGLGIEMPLADNPGALTRAQFDADPTQADGPSVMKESRKTVHQVQIGLQMRQPLLGDGELTAQVYGGTRSLYNPQTFAVVGVGRHQSGAGTRLTLPWKISGVSTRVSVGVDGQYLDDKRKNWANCDGVSAVSATCPTLPGELGAISLDQQELVSNAGAYVRDEVAIGRLDASVGVRADQVRFQLRDHYLGDGRDDSGVRTMQAVSPMAGVSERVSTVSSVYANAGSAFETPTTTELGNHPDGSAGLNPDLKPQFSTTYETGSKGLLGSRVQYDVAFFDTEVRDELIQYGVPNGNGRTYYRNAGRTRRRGAELQLGTEVGPVSLLASYALSRFRFKDFVNGSAQYAGDAIPGIPTQQAQVAATWHVHDVFVVGEGQAKSKVFVNDANAAAAPGFAVFNARIGAKAPLGKPWLSPFIGVQNMFDTHYVGSVAVNAAGATVAATKFYEPSPGRTFVVGLSAAASPW